MTTAGSSDLELSTNLGQVLASTTILTDPSQGNDEQQQQQQQQTSELFDSQQWTQEKDTVDEEKSRARTKRRQQQTRHVAEYQRLCKGTYRRKDVDLLFCCSTLTILPTVVFVIFLGLFYSSETDVSRLTQGTCIQYSVKKDNHTGQIIACWKLEQPSPDDEPIGTPRPYCQTETQWPVPTTRTCYYRTTSASSWVTIQFDPPTSTWSTWWLPILITGTLTLLGIFFIVAGVMRLWRHRFTEPSPFQRLVSPSSTSPSPSSSSSTLTDVDMGTKVDVEANTATVMTITVTPPPPSSPPSPSSPPPPTS